MLRRDALVALTSVVVGLAACSGDDASDGLVPSTAGGTTSSGVGPGGAGGAGTSAGGANTGGATTSTSGGEGGGGVGGSGVGGSGVGGSGGAGGAGVGGASGSVCGDGVVEAGETCDDGVITTDCDTWHDGGDGSCVAPGTCSADFVLVGQQCEPELLTANVIIDVSNSCVMSVTPQSFTVAAGQKLRLSYQNVSNSYAVDVWKSYGGGYTDLPPGGVWNETYEHCFGPNPVTEYADISTACSDFRLHIYCL